MPAAISASPTCTATWSASSWPDNFCSRLFVESLHGRLCPKKGVWNFQAPKTPGTYTGSRVTDTFFCAKPASLATRDLRRGAPLQFLFVITLFLSSALIFLIH